MSTERDRDLLWDFLVQMRLAAWENCPLHELARGSVDLLAKPVVHGPWPAESCAAVQRLWFRQRWVGLYYPTLPESWNLVTAPWRDRTAADGTLTTADAEELLAQPERWVLGDDDGHVELFLTDDGYAEPWERWYDTAVPLASTLTLTRLQRRPLNQNSASSSVLVERVRPGSGRVDQTGIQTQRRSAARCSP